jgi:hypothetical protein
MAILIEDSIRENGKLIQEDFSLKIEKGDYFGASSVAAPIIRSLNQTNPANIRVGAAKMTVLEAREETLPLSFHKIDGQLLIQLVGVVKTEGMQFLCPVDDCQEPHLLTPKLLANLERFVCWQCKCDFSQHLED